MIERLIVSLVVTLVIEAAVAFALGVRTLRGQAVVALTNVVTNPLTVVMAHTIRTLMFIPRFCVEIPLEAVVAVAEWFIYDRVLKRSGSSRLWPLLLSFLCNLISYGSGLIFCMVRDIP